MGLAAIEQVKQCGTWDIPIAFLVRDLEGIEPELSNFQMMSCSVKRTYTAFYQDERSESKRIKRLKYIVGRLNENRKPM